jgi:hypothetical protein
MREVGLFLHLKGNFELINLFLSFLFRTLLIENNNEILIF